MCSRYVSSRRYPIISLHPLLASTQRAIYTILFVLFYIFLHCLPSTNTEVPGNLYYVILCAVRTTYYTVEFLDLTILLLPELCLVSSSTPRVGFWGHPPLAVLNIITFKHQRYNQNPRIVRCKLQLPLLTRGIN